MKPKFTIGLSILLSLALVVFGLVYGSVSGYADERAAVSNLLTGENGLVTVLNYRASDGYNLCVVAERHLPGDETVAALRTAADAVRGAEPDPAVLPGKDRALAEAFHAVAALLKSNESFNADQRDPKYLTMLTADFSQYGENAIYAAYNKAADAFNQKLQTPVLGDMARFFGVKPCPLYV